jgi:hypothetical protein
MFFKLSATKSNLLLKDIATREYEVELSAWAQW